MQEEVSQGLPYTAQLFTYVGLISLNSSIRGIQARALTLWCYAYAAEQGCKLSLMALRVILWEHYATQVCI